MLRMKDLPANVATSVYSISPSSGRLMHPYQKSGNQAHSSPKLSYIER
jgi:hypothetical protein